MDHYILKDGEVIPVDFMTWADWFEHHPEERMLFQTYVNTKGDIVFPEKGQLWVAEVSTVFLGLDHNFLGDGPPILYESMVFVNEPHTVMGRTFSRTSIDASQLRYATMEEASRGHHQMVADVQTALREGIPLMRVNFPLLGGS